MCNLCEHAGTPTYKYPCSECVGFIKFKVKNLPTNADHIRSMSDEELAKFIHEPFCDNRTHEECTISYCGDCYQCGLDWLRQPAEGGQK